LKSTIKIRLLCDTAIFGMLINRGKIMALEKFTLQNQKAPFSWGSLLA
jgi:hypothetical protein